MIAYERESVLEDIRSHFVVGLFIALAIALRAVVTS
jgi:hypothetical protein